MKFIQIDGYEHGLAFPADTKYITIYKNIYHA